MSNKDGRRFLWLELQECKVFEQTVVFGAGGHAASAFNEGKRTLGLKKLAELMAYPEDYMRMTVENSTVKLEMEDERSTDDTND
jgi:hypothetical protein